MKYRPFAPDPAAVAARMTRSIVAPPPDVADRTQGKVTDPAAGSDSPVPATLEGITALRDRAFVQAAYRLMLKRDADPAGLEEYVLQLRSGALDKIDILGDLRNSPEGQKNAVELPGLDWRYGLRRLGRRGGVGAAFRWLVAVMRLPTIVRTAQRHQAEIEQASVVAEDHAAAIRTMIGELREVRAQMRTLSTRLQTAEGALGDAFDRLKIAEKDATARYEHLGAANARLIQQLQEMAAVRGSATPVGAIAQAASSRMAASDDDERHRWYVGFEDRFRGSREDTKRSQETYLGYVTAANAGTLLAPILDIGCGRGEWLELLREHGCVARGVDLNAEMAAANRDRGLEVTEQDVLTYLSTVPDSSLGMITGFHVIEHLHFDVLVRLLDESRRVLRRGGCLVFETPNPENLVVGAYTFYLDPTHRQPLPPQMIEHVVGNRGFSDVEILRLHPREEPGADNAFLDRWFRSATDYAVIGWKDGKGCAS